MRMSSATLGVFLLLSTACSSAPPPPPFKPVADVKQLMATVVDHAADEYWDAVGIVIDAQGEHQIEPQTVEEWDEVTKNAIIVAESGNLLMMPTRAKDSGEWMRLAQALVDTGQKAIRAAEARNKQAVFDAGAEVYDACTNCHVKYALEIQNKRAQQQSQ